MKIGIYARGLSEKSGGAKQYIESASNAIIDIIPDKDEVYIIHNLEKKYFNSLKNNVHELLLKSNSKIMCDYILAPKKINELNLDVVLFTKNFVPFFIKTQSLVVILDLAYFMPELEAYKLLDNLYWRTVMKSSSKRANKIIAISKNTKKDIVSFFKISPSKIKVVYLAADKKYKIIKDRKKINRLKEKYNLSDKFIFYSGSLSPRKNLIRAIMAFNKISKKINCDFVITGNKVWNSEDVSKLIKKNKKIKVTGFINDDEMPLLYSLAEICIYPSIYEGFGLPILEAQACGCPVITSNVSSMPEIAGKGALLVNPYSVEDIINAMKSVIKDKKLRGKLIKEGYKNVKKFSWKKYARKILKICEEVYNEK